MNPRPEWRDLGNRRCLLLRFDGHFSAENALDAISTISSLVEQTEGKTTMVWECTGMTSYDTAAREDWQVLIKDIKSKIESIHLVSESLAVRSWAMVVGSFAGIKITTWATLDDFHTRG